MTRSLVAAARLWWLGAGLASADYMISQDVDKFNKLANENADGFVTQTFKSSDIIAPVFNVNSWDKDLTDDVPYIFIGANYGDSGAGPIILDASDLSVVYADQSWSNAYHSEMQTIHGKPHFTFFANTHEGDHPGQRCVIVDEHYQIKYEVRAVDPHRPDMHELHVTDEGTAIFTTNGKISFDLSRYGGPEDGHAVNYGFQEVNLLTNEVMFEWRANEHDDPDDSMAFWDDRFGLHEKEEKDGKYNDLEGTFDIWHYNSVRKESGNYLVSARNYCHIKYIDGKTGEDLWVLGGKRNQFEDLSDGRATDFCWQHNARFINGDATQLTLFDNHSLNQGDCGDEEGMDKCETRGLQLELDFDNMTARVVHEYYHPGHSNSGAMGGMQKLNSGNSIIGWGWTPSITEFTDDGRVAMDIQRGIVGVERQNNMFAYRVFKSHWKGRPTWPPSVVAEKGSYYSPRSTFYMSWNGATDIAKWAIFTSRNSRQVDVMAGENISEFGRTGFETSAEIDHKKLLRYVVVAALDKEGEVLGMSDVYDMGEQFNTQVIAEEEPVKPVILENQEPYKDEGDGYSTIGYAGAGAAFGGFVVVAGGASLAIFLFFRRKRAQVDKRDTKYYPVMTEEQP